MGHLFRKCVAVAEVLAVLLLGYVAVGVGLALFLGTGAMAPDLAPGMDFLPLARISSTSLVARFGFMLLLAALAWRLRRRHAPGTLAREWGIGLGGSSLPRLLGVGVVLYAVGSLPLELLILAHELLGLGEGLARWELAPQIGWRPDFVLYALLVWVLLPALLEEPLARGYMRSRLAEDFGPMGGVVLSAAAFSLARGEYVRADPVLLLALPALLFQALCWAYTVWRMGSLLPAVVAHALAGMPLTGSVFAAGLGVAAMAGILLLERKRVARGARRFAADWRGWEQRSAAGWALLGIGLVAGTMAAERWTMLGWLALFVAVAAAGMASERRARPA